MVRHYISIFIIAVLPLRAVADATLALWQANPDLKMVDYADGKLTSLWRSEETPNKLGSILLLPDWGRLPTSPEVIDPLRQQLPKLGWETIAVLPPIPEQRLNLITQAEPGEASDTYKKSLVAAMQAIEQAKSEQFGYQVVIAQGVMASWILEIYTQNLYPLPDALILIGSYLPQVERNKAMADQIASLPRPVLDLSFTTNNIWVHAGAEPRRIAAAKQQKLDYRQQTITGEIYRPETSAHLAKSIYGWLSSLGWY
jgi:hypothetical protein